MLTPEPTATAPVRHLRGLEKLCKLYGRMQCGTVMMAWDYAREVAVPETELKADKERWATSERVRWAGVANQQSSTPTTQPAHGF